MPKWIHRLIGFFKERYFNILCGYALGWVQESDAIYLDIQRLGFFKEKKGRCIRYEIKIDKEKLTSDKQTNAAPKIDEVAGTFFVRGQPNLSGKMPRYRVYLNGGENYTWGCG